MHEQNICGFREAVSALGKSAQSIFSTVGEQEMALAGEIRLRAGSPAVISLPSGPETIGTSIISKAEIEQMVFELCGQSVYTHQHEMASGYISVPGGHRAGICGQAVIKEGKITALRDVTGICLRIARDYPGCSTELINSLFSKGVSSYVIAGAPCSGKTTLLRDMARELANGYLGRRLNVSVVDERGEFSSGGRAIDTCCDVLRGYPKSYGIEQAIRGLSPDVIICDELGGGDASAIKMGADAGVVLICSIHAGSKKELVNRIRSLGLLECGAFSGYVLLCGRDKPGAVRKIYSPEEIYEMAGSDNTGCVCTAHRNFA